MTPGFLYFILFFWRTNSIIMPIIHANDIRLKKITAGPIILFRFIIYYSKKQGQPRCYSSCNISQYSTRRYIIKKHRDQNSSNYILGDIKQIISKFFSNVRSSPIHRKIILKLSTIKKDQTKLKLRRISSVVFVKDNRKFF